MEELKMWTDVLADRMKVMGPSALRDIFKVVQDRSIISFAGGLPNEELFPVEAFSKAYQEILQKPEEAQDALQYGITDGCIPLRKWLVGYMKSLGVDVGIENILITSGSQQALDYFGKVFISPGDTVLLNYPTYLGAIQAFMAYEPIFERIFYEGNNLADYYRNCAAKNNSKIKFAYVCSEFSNPTGVTLSKQQRLKLIDVANELCIPLLEDGAYQALRYEGEKIPPIFALELAKKGDINKMRTIYCGSFSKTISPGLRLGWVVASEDILKKLIILKQAADLHTSTMNQMVLTNVVSNIFDQQIEKTCAFYNEKRLAMLEALKKYMPDTVKWNKPEGGMFIWCEFPENINTDELFSKALESKVAIVPGAGFYPDKSGKNTCRLSFSSGSLEQIDEGIKRLAAIVKAA